MTVDGIRPQFSKVLPITSIVTWGLMAQPRIVNVSTATFRLLKATYWQEVVPLNFWLLPEVSIHNFVNRWGSLEFSRS